MEHADTIIKLVLDHILTFPMLKDIVIKHSNYERLALVFHQYLDSLFSSNISDDYIKIRERIGLTHTKSTLPVDWFLATFHLFQSLLIPLIVNKYQHNPEKLGKVVLAVNHAMSFDAQIIVETYMKSRMNQIEEINEANTSLQEELISISQQLAATIQQTEANTTETAEKASRIGKEIEHTLDTSRHIQLLTSESDQDLHLVDKTLHQLMSEVKESLTKIKQLEENANKINSMTTDIEKVAEQTNLLALNASIEAARAGGTRERIFK